MKKIWQILKKKANTFNNYFANIGTNLASTTSNDQLKHIHNIYKLHLHSPAYSELSLNQEKVSLNWIYLFCVFLQFRFYYMDMLFCRVWVFVSLKFYYDKYYVLLVWTMI